MRFKNDLYRRKGLLNAKTATFEIINEHILAVSHR